MSARASREESSGVVDRTVRARDLGQVLQLTCEPDLLAQRGHTSLELQQTHGDLPAVTGFADDQVRVGHRVVEKDLVEFRCAGELLDRTHGDAGLVERDQEEAQTGMSCRPLLRPRYHEHPLRDMRQRGPDLLAVDDPLTVLDTGIRRDPGEVGACTGFGVTLRPQLGDVDDARQEALLLLLRAVRDERRTEQLLAQMIHPGGRVGAGVLAVEDDPLLQRRPRDRRVREANRCRSTRRQPGDGPIRGVRRRTRARCRVRRAPLRPSNVPVRLSSSQVRTALANTSAEFGVALAHSPRSTARSARLIEVMRASITHQASARLGPWRRRPSSGNSPRSRLRPRWHTPHTAGPTVSPSSTTSGTFRHNRTSN